MKSRPSKLFFLSLITLSLIWLVSACSESTPDDRFITPEGTYPVDPFFRELYDHLGGRQTMGAAITTPREFWDDHGNRYKFQVTVNSVLLYDFQASPNKRFTLFPVGLGFGVQEPKVNPPHDQEQRYIDGHVIYDAFIPLYDELGGARFVGTPLTEVRYNPEKKRLEQYFSNLGFFTLDNDPERQVQLLAYGASYCDALCRYTPPDDANVISSYFNLTESFAKAYSRLGTSFVGRQLSNPIEGPDGNLEVIFDNQVLYIDADFPERVFARPLVIELGFEPHALVAPIADERMYFYLIEDGLGHNIPFIFYNFLSKHGGIDNSGPPITEIYEVEPGIWQQCFTNLCLEYNHSAEAEDFKIRPTSLGQVYIAQAHQQLTEAGFSESQSLQALTIKVWELKPVITSAETQEIFVGIFEDQTPLSNLEPDLTVTYSSGPSETINFPPTDPQGITSLKVTPIRARNGTIIPYEVCLNNLQDEKTCVKDSYLIWGNP